MGLEAMAHGVPVAAFDLGGVREYLMDTKNGFAVPESGDMNVVFRLIYEQNFLLPKLSKAALETHVISPGGPRDFCGGPT